MLDFEEIFYRILFNVVINFKENVYLFFSQSKIVFFFVCVFLKTVPPQFPYVITVSSIE